MPNSKPPLNVNDHIKFEQVQSGTVSKMIVADMVGAMVIGLEAAIVGAETGRMLPLVTGCIVGLAATLDVLHLSNLSQTLDNSSKL